MAAGSGFFINGEGWIVTNNHVIAKASAGARVRMSNNYSAEIEGIIARSPERDIAILKISNPPPDIMTLDISLQGMPELGIDVFAFGHPLNVDFSLTKGSVGRVVTTSQLDPGVQQMLRGTANIPGDQIWIQHDAKIFPGNSGGPLFDKQARVLGVNTFVRQDVQFGYASHIKYVKELADGASGRVTPLPPAGDIAGQKPALPPGHPPTPAPGQPPVTPPGAPPGQPPAAPPGQIRVEINPQRMQQLYDDCGKFNWKPQAGSQYEKVGELVRMMTMGKHMQTAPGGVPPDAVKGVVALAEQLVGKMRGLVWGPEQIGALNRFAAERVGKAGDGLLFGASVAGQSADALIFKLDGTDKSVVAKVPADQAKAAPGSRWLVLGFVGGSAQVQGPGGAPQQMPLVMSYYMLPVK